MVNHHDNREREPRELELVKMYHDSFKHMMTFCAGAIVAAATVSGALFSNPTKIYTLIISIVLFIFGALAAMAGLVVASDQLWPRFRRENRGMMRTVLITSLVLAFFGLMFFAGFALGNVLR